jgi:hypothetical protein
MPDKNKIVKIILTGMFIAFAWKLGAVGALVAVGLLLLLLCKRITIQ